MKIAFVVVCVLVGITFSIPVEREKRRVFQQICLTSADCEASNHQCVRRNGEGFGYCMSTDSPSDIEDHKDDSTYISIPKSLTPNELDSINSQRKRRSTDVSPDQDKYGPSGVETDVDDPEHVRHSLRDLKKEALPCSGSKCESDDSKRLELVEKRNLPGDEPKHRVPRGSTVLQNLKNYEPKPTNDYSDGNDLILPANAGDIMEQSAFQRAIYVKRRDVQDYDAEDDGDNDEEEEDESVGEGADDNEVDNGDENDSSDDEVLPDDGSITNYLKNLIRSKRSASQNNKINSSKRRKRQNDDDDDEDDDEYEDDEDEEDDNEETPDETEEEIESLLDSLSRKKRELPKPSRFVQIGGKNVSNIKEIKTLNRYKRNAIDDIADMLNDLEGDNDEDDEEDDDENEVDEDESEEIDEEESDDTRRKKRDYDDDDDDEEDDNEDDGEDESEDDEDDDLYSLLARRKRSLMSNEPDDVPQPIRKRQTDIDEDYDDAEDDGDDGDDDDDDDDEEDDEDDDSELYSLISRRKRTAELKKDTKNPISVKKRKADDDEDYDSDEDGDDDDDDDEDDDEEEDQREDYDENVSKLITLLNRGKRHTKTEAGTDMSMSKLKSVDDSTPIDDFDMTFRSRKKRQDEDEDNDDDDDDDDDTENDDDDDDENDEDDGEDDGEDDDDDSPIDESELLTLLSRSKRNADLQDLADLNLALSTNNDNQKQILEGLKKLEKMKNSEDTSVRNYEYADDDDYDEYYDDSDQKKSKQSPVQNAGPLPPNLGTQSAAQVKQPELPIAAGMNWQQLGVTTNVNPTTPANVTEGPKQKRSGGSNSDYYDEQDTGTGAVDELLDEDYDGSAGHTDSEVTQADLKRAIIGILKDAGHKKQIQKRSLDFEIGSSKESSQGFVKTAQVLEEIDTDANSGL